MNEPTPDPVVLAVHNAECGCSSLVHPESERWDYYARIADAVRASLGLTTEHGLVFDGDVTRVGTSQQSDPGAAERWVRMNAGNGPGAVYIRDVTPWRPESTQEQS